MSPGTPWSLEVPGSTLPFDMRVGTDVQPVHEVEEAIRAHGTRYLSRLFTTHEISSCGGPTAAAESLAPGLAARFAAKEATMKVLRPTRDLAPLWTEIEVLSQPGGWTDLALIGHSAGMARQAGLVFLRLSMSHGGDFAVATVVAIGYERAIRPDALRS